jgi:hypothetical protein
VLERKAITWSALLGLCGIWICLFRSPKTEDTGAVNDFVGEGLRGLVFVHCADEEDVPARIETEALASVQETPQIELDFRAGTVLPVCLVPHAASLQFAEELRKIVFGPGKIHLIKQDEQHAVAAVVNFGVLGQFPGGLVEKLELNERAS